jgi:hypothetical protein
MASGLRVPDWLLERLNAGELPPKRAEDLFARLRADGEEQRLSHLAESDAEILTALPPAQVAREIERRAARAATAAEARANGPGTGRRQRPLWAFTTAAVFAASIAIFVAVFQKDSEDTRIKGDEHHAALRIYRKTKVGSELLGPNTEVSKGDTLQIRYLAAGKHYGVIASVDGRGTVTLHLPESPGQAALLSREGERALAHAYELDDSPRFERFVFVTSDAHFATDDVVRSLRSGATLQAPFKTYEIFLRKPE